MLSRRLWIAGAIILNAILVSAPLAFVNVPPASALPILLLVAGSTLICATELWNTADNLETLSEYGAYQYAALAGSLLLLLTKWSSLVEFLLPGQVTSSLNMVSGVLLVSAGCVVRSLSIRTLADGFRSETAGQFLATDGIFARMRHPSESGLLLATLGITLITGSWRTALILLPLTLLFSLIRIRLEERWLRAAFGDDYIRYCCKIDRRPDDVRGS